MDVTKPPTKMKKEELFEALKALGYTEDDLTDDKGKILKRPELLTKLNEHQKGEEGMAIFDIDDDSEEAEESESQIDIADYIQEPTDSADHSDDEEEEDGVEIDIDSVDDNTNNNEEDPVVLQENMAVEIQPDRVIRTGNENVEFVDPPPRSSKDWTQYVIGQFADDELDDGNPRVEGLRRVTEELVGTIIEEGCDLVASPCDTNDFTACAKAWAVLLDEDSGATKRFEALADASPRNCVDDYGTYLVAMADTRAKGRVYRNALGLRKVVSAEELNKGVDSAGIVRDGNIQKGQISLIRMMADRHSINLEEILSNMKVEFTTNKSTGEVNLQSLTYDQAVEVTKAIREKTQNGGKK